MKFEDLSKSELSESNTKADAELSKAGANKTAEVAERFPRGCLHLQLAATVVGEVKSGDGRLCARLKREDTDWFVQVLNLRTRIFIWIFRIHDDGDLKKFTDGLKDNQFNLEDQRRDDEGHRLPRELVLS